MEAEAATRQVLDDALQALGWGLLTSYDDHIVLLAARCGESDSRSVVLRTVRQGLDHRLQQAWEGGWQPADIHRMAGRRATSAVATFSLRVMRQDLSRHARDTVHPTWWTQLEDLGAGDGAGGSKVSDPLTDARASGASWLVLLDTAVRCIQLFGALPPIQRVTALPGAWRRPPGTEPSSVDQRILTRVRMLLAKAESTPYEAEAETFTAGAAALIARHRIDEAMLDDSDPSRAADGASARRIGIDNPYEQPKVHLLDVVAQANSCKVVWSKELGFATVIGFPSDLDGVDLLYTSLLLQATRTMSGAGQQAKQGAHQRSRSFRASFLTSFAVRIGERLRQTTEAEERSASAELGASTGSRLPALVAREQHVADAVTELFPQLVQSRSRATFDAEGWHHGRLAADRAQMEVRPTLGEGSA